MLMQNLRGQTKNIMVFSEVAYFGIRIIIIIIIITLS